MIEQRNYFIYDLETTGTDPESNHEIIQIGARALKYTDYSHIKDFQLLFKPQFPDHASPDAIKVIGEQLWEKAKAEGTHPRTGLRLFYNWITELNPSQKYWNSPIRVGYNICSFDNPMIEFWMKKYKICKNNEWPWCWYSKDVLSQMLDLFANDNLPNRKLNTFAKMFGLHRIAETHDALEDVIITSQLFIRYMKMMTKVRKKIKILTPEQYTTSIAND